jgi:tetratricopeptide (TPR) repeat protein
MYVFEEGVRTIAFVGQKAQWSVEEMHLRIDQLLKDNKHMEQQEHGNKMISRRDVLLLLTGFPAAVMGLDLADTSSLHPEEVVSLCLTAIPACWSLVYAGDIQQVVTLRKHVEKVLPRYLARLTSVIQQSSHHRQLAANLASQGYKLANLFALQREDFPAALQYSQDALTYGEIAGAANLQVAALIEEALTFWYRKRPVQTLETYQKALQRAQGVSPIIEGRLYVGLAGAYAKLGQEKEALRYMGLAQEIFPEHPERDPVFPYTHYSRYYLYLYEGLMYRELNQPAKALEAYAHFHVPEYTARRMEIANREAAALLALGDLHQCYEKVEKAVTLAVSMNSDLRYSEAYEIWQGMLIKWPHEHKVKELTALFQK